MKGNSSKFLALLLSASMIMSPTASVLADTQEKAAQTESSAAAEEAPQSEETAETAEPETTPAETESSESTAETPAEEPTETPAAPAEDQTPAGSDETETPSADEDASEDTAEDTAKDGEETADTTEKEPEAPFLLLFFPKNRLVSPPSSSVIVPFPGAGAFPPRRCASFLCHPAYSATSNCSLLMSKCVFNFTVNTVPSRSLFTWILPPCISATLFAIASPRPVPPVWVERDCSTR
jgi:hypothetical protein